MYLCRDDHCSKSKETMKDGNGINLIHILHYNLKLPDVYVGNVGWMYRTKIDPISIRLVSLLF